MAIGWAMGAAKCRMQNAAREEYMEHSPEDIFGCEDPFQHSSQAFIYRPTSRGKYVRNGTENERQPKVLSRT